MKLTKIMFALLLSSLFIACCPCKSGKSRATSPLKETNWQLVQLEGRAFDADNNYFITLGADGRLSGKGDCNRIMGSYTEDNGKLTFGQMASTRMFCPNQSQEDDFIKMISEIDAYKQDGNMLMLLRNGELVAMFEAIKSVETK